MANKMIAFLLIALALGALGWFLFGWTGEDHPYHGQVEYRRYFGKVTKIELDTNRDGQLDSVAVFPWSAPFKGGPVHRPRGDMPHEIREDRNFDGRWDVWLVGGGMDEEDVGLTTFKVDTDDDGQPDWDITVPFYQWPKAYQQIKEKRGF